MFVLDLNVAQLNRSQVDLFRFQAMQIPEGLPCRAYFVEAGVLLKRQV
jgi:hypothetical protein